MVDPTNFNEVLQHLIDRDNSALDNERERICDIHEHMPEMAAKVARAVGIDEVQLLRLANDTGCAHNMRWYDVIRVLHSFCSYKKLLERTSDDNA